MRQNILTGLAVLALVGNGLAYSHDNKDDTTYHAPDNSGVNKSKNQGLTAEEQSTTKKDTEITRRIRQELVKDDKLSTYGKNVKVITNDGRVTLKGPVHSESEKFRIVKKAQRIAGPSHVVNELEVSDVPKSKTNDPGRS